jgi:hypothetical protein
VEEALAYLGQRLRQLEERLEALEAAIRESAGRDAAPDAAPRDD